MIDGPIDALRSGLASEAPALVTGLSRPALAYLAAQLHQRDHTSASTIITVPTETDARALHYDLLQHLPPRDAAGDLPRPEVLLVPALELSPYSEVSSDRVALRQRMAALFHLASEPGGSTLLILSARSLLRRVIPKEELLDLCDEIEVDKEIDRDLLTEALIAAGYNRVTIVEEPGHFAVRGGVVDLFPPAYRFPVRIELFGDDVESIRHFDTENQRTLRTLSSVRIHPVRESVCTRGSALRNRLLEAGDKAAHPSKATRHLIDSIQSGVEFVGIENLIPAFHKALAPLSTYLASGPDVRHLVFDPANVMCRAEDELEDAQRRYEDQIDGHRIAFEPEEHYLSVDEVRTFIGQSHHRIDCQVLKVEGEAEKYGQHTHISVDDNIALRGQLDRLRKTKAEDLSEPLLTALAAWKERGFQVALACRSASRLGRLKGLLTEKGLDVAVAEERGLDWELALPAGPPLMCRANLSSGFALPEQGIAIVTDDDVFGEKRRSTGRQKRAAQRAREALKGGVSDFSQLRDDDFLVHTIHGIGLFKGLRKLPIQGVPTDFLLLEYQGGNLYLPVVRIGEVQRYVGAEGLSPRLDKLGGQSFTKTKHSVSRKVHALAEELLQLYAQRAALPGHAFPKPDSMFHEFEATFEFEETPDQQKAIDDIEEDMGEPRPMDRLVCGDVGYGKTEVALRAILRSAFGGKQVAFLAPTTVLVEQHYQTMLKRFAGWPVRIARLSRFQTKRQQIETIKELATGQIDAVVGTHRLLSADVRFKDLGLLVIDEEQRFGVAHKERFKKMRASIEVLTLTATPIPRTLHLAMTGLRDLSIIATPPADRRAIRTFVARSEDGVLKEAIRKELDRKGQVFFISPRIDTPVSGGERSLEEWAAHLGQLVPSARIAMAHGQMPSEKLEKIMVGFVEGKYDVLVATTIVEAGLDIPRANTMFVDRADRFGLSQLYQLRGRIGRSRERAYCYLMVPAPEKLSDDARKRLETLQRYTDLGAGFSIASQDLEIRGAGDLLGAKQSGSIAAIGFDAYTQMLEEAVAELRGEPVHSERDPELNVDIPGFIPDDYVPDTAQRLALYKRLASALDADEVREILEEMIDCYGPLPGEVGTLGELMVVKSQARRLRALSLELGPARLVLALGEDTPLDPAQVMNLMKQHPGRYKLTPDMRLVRQFSEAEREEPVIAAKATLMELLGCATPMATGV
ncbi:MAG: transcription-repair coupling factor [Myxococcales bacterium]|nr:transcription-repair coupling factor [Myxococcales bacterium]